MSLIDKLQEQEPIPLADDDPQGTFSIESYEQTIYLKILYYSNYKR